MKKILLPFLVFMCGVTCYGQELRQIKKGSAGGQIGITQGPRNIQKYFNLADYLKDSLGISPIQYARQTVAVFSDTLFMIPADSKDLQVFLGGLLQEEQLDYSRNKDTLQFHWRSPGLKLTVIYHQ